MQGAAYKALVNDIRINGQREAIVLHEGMVLDGRNRQRVCRELGLEPKTKAFKGKDPLAYVISANLHRRHLDESQRCMVAAQVATLAGKGRPAKNAPIGAITQDDAASMLNVSRRGVQRAKIVRDKGSPELIEAVEQGDIAVSLAAKITELPPAKQRDVVAEPKTAVGAVKKHRRQRRVEELAEKTEQASQSLAGELYSVLYADPPWRFEPYSRDTGMDRAADNHYPTMGGQDIRELPIPAADDAVLFLWATVPMLPDAVAVMQAWGFAYKSHFVWIKDKAGTGYWNRNQHELLLIGTRGKIPAPAPGEQFPSVIPAKVGKHSAKPEHFAEMIEEMFPQLQAVELFARKPRLGWKVWGNEAPT
ncbi:MAG TPA: MT-A70 family methyltransferase [Acetobacteraceae bacterium]|nr:MT-A70 family methyltransferase [Acetobacteraceae bacterium]